MKHACEKSALENHSFECKIRFHRYIGDIPTQCTMNEGNGLRNKTALTVNKRCEEHAEPAESALLIGPHPHDSHAIIKHHIIGHGAAELGFEVFDGTATIVYCHKVFLALVGVFHLVLHEAQVDLQIHRIFIIFSSFYFKVDIFVM